MWTDKLGSRLCQCTWTLQNILLIWRYLTHISVSVNTSCYFTLHDIDFFIVTESLAELMIHCFKSRGWLCADLVTFEVVYYLQLYVLEMLLLSQGERAAAETGNHILCKPSFLQTMLKEIVLAGKSMELLTTLEQRVDILRGTSLCWLLFCHNCT